MQLKLSKAIVELKDEMTWGDQQKVELAMHKTAKATTDTKSAGKDMIIELNHEATFDAKYVLLECMVMSIKEGEKDVSFSRDWMNNLTVDDGNNLYDTVEKLTKKEESLKETEKKSEGGSKES